MVAKDLIIAIDMGTTSCKCNAIDLSGYVVAEASASYSSRYPQEGWVEQRPDDWLESLRKVLADVTCQLAGRAKDVQAIGLTGQGGGFLLCDAHARSLTPCLTWQDRRSQSNGEALLKRLGPEQMGGVLGTTGLAAKLDWAKEHWPDEARRSRWVLGVKDFVAFWLTGEVGTEPKALEVTDAVLEAIDFPKCKLPPVIPATSVLGELKSDIARDNGLLPLIPVVNGLYDGGCAALGAGAICPGDGCLTIGSNAVARLVWSEPMDPRVASEIGAFSNPLVDDLWLLGGFTNAGGLCLDWFVGVTALAEGATLSGHQAVLAEAAEVPPGADGLVFLPHLLGRGCPARSESARGAFVGLSIRHGRGHLARAVLEGVAYSVKRIYSALLNRGFTLRSVAVTGGGGRDPLWRQILADVLEAPLTAVSGGSARGAAMLAAIGIGAFTNVQSAAAAMVKSEALTEPTPGNVQAYRCGYRSFLESDTSLFGGLLPPASGS
jgi:xylulokinase